LVQTNQNIGHEVHNRLKAPPNTRKTPHYHLMVNYKTQHEGYDHHHSDMLLFTTLEDFHREPKMTTVTPSTRDRQLKVSTLAASVMVGQSFGSVHFGVPPHPYVRIDQPPPSSASMPPRFTMTPFQHGQKCRGWHPAADAVRHDKPPSTKEIVVVVHHLRDHTRWSPPHRPVVHATSSAMEAEAPPRKEVMHPRTKEVIAVVCRASMPHRT
jgi:hypothetical protein